MFTNWFEDLKMVNFLSKKKGLKKDLHDQPIFHLTDEETEEGIILEPHR